MTNTEVLRIVVEENAPKKGEKAVKKDAVITKIVIKER